MPRRDLFSFEGFSPANGVGKQGREDSGLSVGPRMLLVFVLSCLAFIARTPAFLSGLTAANLAVLFWLGHGPLSLWREARVFCWQTLIILALYLLRFGDLAGLGKGLLVSWQLFLAFLPGMVFVRTTSQARIVQALNRIMPCRTAFVLSTCLKFVPHLVSEIRNIYEGQVLRGARILPRDLAKPWNWPDLLHCVVVPAVVQGMALAGNIALAARARDFGRYPRRTCWPGE
ncbi:MAG: energy-coupling factor transporter transmembrane component T [Syntrophotaleaceae bacterium]